MEKPCGSNADQLRPLVRAAQNSGLLTMVGTMWRHTRATGLFNRFIVGKPKSQSLKSLLIQACFPPLLVRQAWDSHPVRLAFLDMFIHPIDFACWFLGEPLSVRAVQTQPFQDGRGGVIVLLQSPGSDRTANIHLSCGSHYYGIDITANCADGSLARIRDLNELVVITSPTWTGTEGGLRDRAYQGWEQGPLYRGYGRRGYAEEISAFYSALTEGVPIASLLDDALLTLKVIDAAIFSLRTGDAVQVASEEDLSAESRGAPADDLAIIRVKVLDCIADAVGLDAEEIGPDLEFGIYSVVGLGQPYEPDDDYREPARSSWSPTNRFLASSRSIRSWPLCWRITRRAAELMHDLSLARYRRIGYSRGTAACAGAGRAEKDVHPQSAPLRLQDAGRGGA